MPSFFILDKMIQTIVDHTNTEGAREKENKWKDIDSMEMKYFIGCLLHTGAVLQKNISVKVLFSSVNRHPFL